MARSWASCGLFALGLLLLAAQLASAELLLSYSVMRHGARNVLVKSDTLQDKSDAAGGPTLLPQGQRQAWNAGQAYRQRYLNASSCADTLTCLNATTGVGNALGGPPQYGVIATPNGTWNNFNSLVRSSALDRTIMTARSFLDAVFPPRALAAIPADSYLPDGNQVVPVFSLQEDGNALVRAYTACPAYDARLKQWYQSDEFAAKEADSQPLRDKVAASGATLNTSLANWWNVFDAFNVYRNYGVGTPMPQVDNETFAQMQELAYWLETAKMRSNLTSNLLAGPLLADLLQKMANASDAFTSLVVGAPYLQLVHLSSHYNTQLGLLGAIQLDQFAPAANVTWLRKIPSLAALMAFELHGNPGTQPPELSVRLVMQDGPEASYTVIPLPCSLSGDSADALSGPGSCTLEAFRALVGPLAINSTGDWCTACQNTAWTACQLQAADAQLQQLNATVAASDSSSSSGGSSLSDGAWAGILVACVVAVAAGFGVAFALYRRRMQAELQQARLGSAQSGMPLDLTA